MSVCSIVMPVYNGLRFLPEAVNSMLQQTFTEFEFIIIDDCSTDGSYEWLQALTDPRIRLYRNETNKGISYTLNRGIELAQTEWIVRMDCDDISYPQRLEQQFKFINENPGGVLYSCNVQVVNEQGTPVHTDRFDGRFYYYNLYFICVIYHPTVVMHKAAVQQVGGYTVPYAEDFNLFWQLAQKHRIYHQDEVLLHYRQSSQSLHQVLRKKEYKDAELEQLLRNFRTVAGNDISIPESYLHCLQHYFEPLEKENNIRSVARCVNTLQQISEGIIRHPNPNNDPQITKEAAATKRRFILEHFMRILPPLKAAALLAMLSEWAYLADRVGSKLPFINRHKKSSPGAAL